MAAVHPLSCNAATYCLYFPQKQETAAKKVRLTLFEWTEITVGVDYTFLIHSQETSGHTDG